MINKKIFYFLLIVTFYFFLPGKVFASVDPFAKFAMVNEELRQCGATTLSCTEHDSFIYDYKRKNGWVPLDGETDEIQGSFKDYCKNIGYVMVDEKDMYVKIFSTKFIIFAGTSFILLTLLIFVITIAKKLGKSLISINFFNKNVKKWHFFIIPFVYSFLAPLILDNWPRKKSAYLDTSLILIFFLIVAWAALNIFLDIMGKKKLFHVYFLNFILGLFSGLFSAIIVYNIF